MTRVLIAEDSPTQAEQLRIILESEGFQVQAAADGKQALALFHSWNPEIVISDILMPGLSGYDLCRKIKSDPKGKDVPVILLTTLKEPMDIIEGLALGAENFITKPYEPEYLVARVKNVALTKRLRQQTSVKIGLDLVIMGKRVTVTSEKEQILDLLISTFEEFLRSRQKEETAKKELAAAHAKLQGYARQLEGRAQLSEEKYRRLVESATDAIVGADGKGNIVLWNSMAERMFGYPPGEILGRPVALLMPERFQQAHKAGLERVAGGGPPTLSGPTRELVGLRKDGTEFPIELSFTVMQEGAESFFTAIIRDISERRQAEAALREREERFRLLAHNAQDLIYRYRFRPIPGFEYVSPAATPITGYTPEEHYADPELGLKVIHPEDRHVIERILKTGEVPEGPLTLRWVRKDGRVIWTEQRNVVVRDSSGNIVAVEGIARDITERRQLEEQLRQAQKMEGIGQLAGGVAHDFNNLLTVINGYSDLLLNRLPEHHPMREDVDEIRKAGERARSLTRQLLAFSRKQILEPRVLDLNLLVTEAEKMLKRLIGEDIELVKVLDPRLGRMKADQGQIEQVILNLAVNSRDAMPRGGRLTLETSNVELDENYARAHLAVRPGPYLMLAVSDSGCGMDKETQARLFEPFFTTKGPGKGTGLGLATVYGIVKQSGGSIWVYSEPGKGTTFKTYFPQVEEETPTRARRKAPPPTREGSETILLAEDENTVRRFTRQVLEMNGYTVLEACHGVEALEVCERHKGPIHLMVTDVVMPKMSGRELAERLARLRPEMKVLYLSGYTTNAIVHHGVLDSDAAFLQKPFTPGALALKVREVLDAPSQARGAEGGGLNETLA